jgi:hypothetical protein
LFLKIQNWCGTDRIVLIKTIRMLFKKLFEDQGGSPDLVSNPQNFFSSSPAIPANKLVRFFLASLFSFV